MPNETLLATLQETRNEIVQERYARIERMQSAQQSAENAKDYLQRAQDQERAAIQRDEDNKAKQTELRNFLNGLTDKPQSIMEKLSRLGAEQIETFRARKAFGEIVKQQQRGSMDAEAALAVARRDKEKIDHDVSEIDAKIQEVQGYRL